MPNPTPTFIDRDAREIYYLGFDLFLVRAPIRNDIAYANESTTVPAMPGDHRTDARHAAIRAALLTAFAAASPGWRATLEEAEGWAAELATKDAPEPPLAISPDTIVTLDIKTETQIPPER